jgi:hypothetical protein
MTSKTEFVALVFSHLTKRRVPVTRFWNYRNAVCVFPTAARSEAIPICGISEFY